MRDFPPTREAGLRRLAEFLPHAGRDYAERRNHVPGTVSALSPYVRHRLVSEEEIARAVLHLHGLGAAEKFLQELCWRTYWKGWLELRPRIWEDFLTGLDSLRKRMLTDGALSHRVAEAEEGGTGIGCFDAWASELRSTGWLHNHVRMWFASLWIHTLRLPWQLGADFFLRHLIDADPASNTLSWRWVCGLQTRGKVYRATADNIAKFTGGRFHPVGLSENPDMPLPDEESPPQPGQLRESSPPPRGRRVLLISTVEDLTPEQWGVDPTDVSGVVFMNASVTGVSEIASNFRCKSLEDAVQRASSFFGSSVCILDPLKEDAAGILLGFSNSSEELVLMAPSVGLLPVGWERIFPTQIPVRRIRRSWDSDFWPHSTHGFFRLRERIPEILGQSIPSAALPQSS